MVFELDQEVESARRIDAANGYWDKRPAAEWRQIDFAHDPSDRELFGMTELQSRLSRQGWDNQGNGATMAALACRGLITRGSRGTALGQMYTVALTRAGRAAARAGTSLTTGSARKAPLGHRAWEVLALLWSCDQEGTRLNWGRSSTIDRVLIDKNNPPLARRLEWYAGYEITDAGREFYREHYAAHTAAHPDVRAPHPDGAEADPWPARVDEILVEHQHHYRALRTAWHEARAVQQLAEAELATAEPEPDPVLPGEIAQLAHDRHSLRQDTAQQRSQLAAEHVATIGQHALRAARGYAACALGVFNAAVAGADPRENLTPPAHSDSWDESRLAPPAETGIHALDTDVAKLHAAAVGAPKRRRGPAPKPRTRGRAATTEEEPPGSNLVALADALRDHAAGGTLLRRLHPAT
ncbi:hypothetical protein FHS23_004600 [Prauserella isguenensis]|uniref:Uncharacterized protein n=1 Tax=Prauserella isguenensis TaxID=1470180 RepID=A0A839S6X8_9PSEU|nr:hypothetical protein [Prauserella isguenensis]MBB3053546.1 hypothetical protein [Prauserella isguenensis]